MGSVHPRREATEHVWIDGTSMPSIDKHLAKYLKDMFCIVYELIDGLEARNGATALTHKQTVGRGLVCEGLIFFMF